MTSPASKRQSLYDTNGAEDGLKRLVRNHSITGSAPRYYLQTHGHSRLREIHEHVLINLDYAGSVAEVYGKGIEKSDIVESTASLSMNFTFAAEIAWKQD